MIGGLDLSQALAVSQLEEKYRRARRHAEEMQGQLDDASRLIKRQRGLIAQITAERDDAHAEIARLVARLAEGVESAGETEKRTMTNWGF